MESLLQRTVLLIDDSLEDRAKFKRYLQHAPQVDYTIYEEGLGEPAFVSCRTLQPDCILLGYQLPDIDGFELLARLRAEDEPLPSAVIVLTGTGDEAVAVEAMKRGAHDYLVKAKTTRQELWRAVAGAIEKAGLERTVRVQRHALEESHQKLQDTVQALHLAQETLEQRVQDRTAALAQANETLHTQAQMLEEMAEGVIVTTKDGNIFFTNRAFDTMFGYDRGELFGQPAGVLTADFLEGPTLTSAPLLAHVRTQGAWRGEVWGCKKDGTGLPTYARISLVELDGKKHTVSIVEDITERQQLEAALRERERLAAVGTTALSLTHEIGNRLNGLSTSVQLLDRSLRQQETPLHGSAQEIVQDLRAELSRLRSVLQDIRILSDVAPLDCRPTNLAAVVAEVLEDQLHPFAQHGIHIEQEFPANLPPALADREKLSQIVLNLCTNAAEAMPRDGVLTLRGSASEGQVRLDVQDTGEGIPPGVQPFEPFTTTKSGGTGLGLAVVQQLVAAHEGTITYTSARGHGTTFTLSLPVSPDEG